MRRRLAMVVLGLGLGLPVFTASAPAQTITLSLGASSSVNWNTANGNPLTPGSSSNAGSNTITVNSVWSLSPAHTGLVLYAYFNSSTAALAHSASICTTGCLDIPSSAVELKINGGAATPMTQTASFGAAGASLKIFTLAISGVNKNSSRSDTIAINLNLSSLTQLPADTYTGTLFIQAQATP